MGTENFKHGVVSILLAFVLVFSMTLVAPLASPGDLIYNPGGTTIEVVQGDNFLIRHTLEWNEPENGAYAITLHWDCYDNHENENFTFMGASAYFTTGAYAGQPILAVITGPMPSPAGAHTRYTLAVRCPADQKDPRNGQFNVDIWMRASGVGGVPHIPTDNHPVPFHFAGVVIIEKNLQFWGRDPIAIRVPSWTGTATFSLVNLYTVNVEKILDIGQGSKLVVKFYTYGDAYENENVIETFSPPWHVEENELARHPGPGRMGVKKARLVLTTDDTENVISTIASFTVRKIDIEQNFMRIPLDWALAQTPEERLEIEIEFSEKPLYWALAPSC